MNKKAQITAFIIIGILILIAVLGIMYFKKAAIIDKPPEEFTKENIPVQVQQIREFVENCLGITARRGFEQLGLHGGFVYPSITIDSVVPPTDLDGVGFLGDITVPYWNYMKSRQDCETCTFEQNIPMLTSYGREADADFANSKTSNVIAEQLNFYINEHLHDCLNHFEQYDELGWTITELDSPEANVVFGDTATEIRLRMPIEAETAGFTSQINTYSTILEIDFKEIYETALRVTQVLTETAFFEKMTREIIDSYSLGNDKAIPPTRGGVEFEMSAGKIWIKTEVARELQQYFADNIPITQVYGSYNNVRPLTDDLYALNLYNNLQIDILDPNSTDDEQYNPFYYDFEFIYLPRWPIYLDVQPSRGGVIMPESALNLFILPFGLQRYDFTYDVSYPIIIKMRDPLAFGLEGYDFMFAFEVNMRNNLPIQRTFEMPRVHSIEEQRDVFCSETNRIYPYRIEVKDARNGDPINDAVVSYRCAMDSCYLGKTALEGGIAVVQDNVPLCLGGVIDVTKNGYTSRTIDLGLVQGPVRPLQILQAELYPEHELEVELKLRPLIKQGLSETWELADNTFDLNIPDERYTDKGIIILRKLTENPAESEYIQVIGFEDDTIQTQTIKLIPGEYSFTTFVTRKLNDGQEPPLHTIEEDEICADGECTTLPAVDFNESIILGSLEYSEETAGQNFVIDAETLYSSQKISFDVPFIRIDDLQKHNDLMAFSLGVDPEFVQSHRSFVEPILS